MTSYDEARLAAWLGAIDGSARRVVAAAMAQRLEPLFKRYSTAAGDLKAQASFNSMLADVWRVLSGEAVKLPDPGDAEALIPDDEDPNWIHESGYAQNAAGALAYAISSMSSEDVQEVVWACRQLYEAADYASADLSRADAQSVESEAIDVIIADISTATEPNLDLLAFRRDALEWAEQWAQKLP